MKKSSLTPFPRLCALVVIALALVLPVAHAQTATTDVPGLRLPRDVLPVAYAPMLTIDPNETRFDGVIDIDVRVDAPLPVGAATLTLRYVGVVEEVNAQGVFRQQDRERWSVFTQFEPLNAFLADLK